MGHPVFEDQVKRTNILPTKYCSLNVIVSWLPIPLSLSLSLTLSQHRKLRTRDSTVLRIQFCVAIILMLLSFVAGIERVQLFQVCVTISTLIHYFTLVSVMWMAAEALLMFQKAVISTNVNYKFFVIISLACWCKCAIYKFFRIVLFLQSVS